MLIGRLAVYGFGCFYVFEGNSEPSVGFLIAMYVMDGLLTVTLIYEVVFLKSIYNQDIFGKVYSFVRLLIFCLGQGVLIEIYYFGIGPREGKKKPFSNLSFVSYFIMGSTVFVITVLSLRTCCRSKDSHPMGNRMTDAAFSSSETARKVSQLVYVLVLASILTFYQVYLVGLADHYLLRDDFILKRIVIIFAGIFIFLSVLTAYAEKHFK